ncbi:MAG: IS1595 family transposase [Acidobacteriaceae bacterium]|nr:IS1595 family transposase [Acidobacteriaceae bacterium]
MTADLLNPIFTNEDAARAHFEKLRWPDGPVCAHCGSVNNSTELKGKSHRKGLYKCKDCSQPFTATIGTIYERSHIPLHKWLLATHLMCSSKKGISAHQLWRMLGFGSYRTAWFMGHRIREAMRDGGPAPLGGSGKTVEADETVIGRVQGAPKSTSKMGGRSGYRNVALTLVERGGSARSFHVTGTTIAELKPVILANIARETALMTDQAAWYPEIGEDFASHETVNHAREEYARRDGERIISTNTVENYYSIFKRGMKGTYQHCAEKHLHRYLAEFDFRYSNRIALGVDDKARARVAVKGVEGKRLTYRQPRPEGLQ